MARISPQDPSLVSIATAHGITPRVAATWFPALVRTPRVLVPIELDVLMVRDPQLAWAQCGMTTPPQADVGSNRPPTPAASLIPPPFQNLQSSRPIGAYLQWYLPNGLRSGTADATANTANFPPLPSRWLVLRISPGPLSTRRTLRGWVLEADGHPPQSKDLDGWTEPGTKPNVQNPLTALGHGDLSWAGYFDNVVNRLGFYDGTLGNVRGPITYMVCGWYTDPRQDPLGDQSITSLAGFNAKMQQLGWMLESGELAEVVQRATSYSAVANQLGLETIIDPRIAAANITSSAAYTTNGSWWPTATLFHGAVVGIDWPQSGDTNEVGGPPDAASITVSVGNTMSETMGTLVALANNAPSEAALVEALQLGVIKELDQPDGRARLDVQLHASSFASMSGGAASTEPFTIAPSGPVQAPPSNPPTPAPGIFTPHTTFETKTSTISAATSSFAGVQEIGQVTVPSGSPPFVHSEETLISGGLSAVLAQLNSGTQTPPSNPGGTVEALRAKPRLYTPKEPVVLIQGAKRAFVHDSTVFTEDGMVVCRLTPVTELSWTLPGVDAHPSVIGQDVLDRGVENGSVPVECEGILAEVVLLDPSGADTMASAAAAASADPASYDVATAQRNITVEQTAWYSLRDPRVDHGPLLAQSGIAGRLPAAYAVAPASRPWTPMHLDWSVEFLPSPKGENDWNLDEIDFVLDATATVPPAGSGITFTGRSAVTGGTSTTLASAIATTLAQVSTIGGTSPVPVNQLEAYYSPLAQQLTGMLQNLSFQRNAAQVVASDPSGVDRTLLSDIATALDQMDVLSCGLNGLLTQLRGGVPGDGVSKPPDGVPSPFFAMRAGFLRFVRLRLVDGFGQFVDLCGSNATHTAQGIVVSGPLTVEGNSGLLGLAPRFSAPTRMWFRYMSANDPGVEADYQTSPVCAFVMPQHLDGSLEFFNADGSSAGSLQPLDDGRVMWQDAPGSPTTVGQSPARVLKNSYAAQFAQSLIDWGVADANQSRESALSGLLRTIDSTLWTVDPFAHAGDEHLSLLVGHPICVMRALLRLDVIDPVVTPDGTVTAVPIRLGNLTQWEDGLLGYFVNDDYTILHATDAAAAGMARQVGPHQGFLQQINLVPQFYASFADDLPDEAMSGATPVTHPYIDPSGVLWIRPNQTINLTLLVEPLTTVHATACLVPRKEIGMRREWVTDGLARIAPTFRFGPVLVDPQHIRMPLATDLNGTWVWDYRSDASTWAENPATNATDNALLGTDPPTGSEGWLKLKPSSERNISI